MSAPVRAAHRLDLAAVEASLRGGQAQFAGINQRLAAHRDPLDDRVVDAGAGADDKLLELRRMYEPFVTTLSEHLLMPLPAWRAGAVARENWRTSAWGQTHRTDPDDPHHDA